MKTRNGFVSNSSSSSFIVNFTPAVITSPQAMHQLLFKQKGSKKLDYYGTHVSSSQVANRIWQDYNNPENQDQSDMIGQITLKLYLEIRDMESSIVHSGNADAPKMRHPYNSPERIDMLGRSSRRREKMFEHLDAISQLMLEDMNDEHILDLRLFKYYDDAGFLEGILEDGLQFENVSHVKVSGH